MIGCIELPRGHFRGSLRAATRALLMAGVLTGCSQVPDAVNPVEWYKGASNFISGKDEPEVATSRTSKGETVADAPKKETAKGLVADRSNAKYAEPVRREATPTKPLARRTAPAAEPQVAASSQEAPKASVPAQTGTPAATSASAPTIAKTDLPPPPAPVQTARSRDAGPSAPAAAMDNTPPARPDIPEAVPVPGQKLKPVHAHYQKRLAESAATVVRPDVVDFSSRSTLASDEPIHLVPPSKKRKASGGRFVAAPEPDAAPAASFQVASVDFRNGSSELTHEDRQAIAEVAKLYRQSGGGVVRVVGLASMNGGDVLAGMERANAVARELSRRGVPGGRIMVAADPTPTAHAGATVFLDVM